MKIYYCLALLTLFSLSAAGASTDLVVKTIKPFQKWTSDQIQETQIAVQLPKNFHAYKDQIKILNIKPSGFKTAQIKLNPEVEFYDKFSKKNRLGLNDSGGVISILFEAPEKLPLDLQVIEFDLRHQICSDQVCYLPENLKITVPISQSTPASTVTSEKKTSSFFASFESSLASNLPLAFLFVFLAGILTSFTPCIFPMLPITLSILGHNAESRTRMQNFLRSVIYVGGIATTYSLLGVIAALTGSLFGAALTNSYVLVGLCILFVTMALSMWGVFELQAPAFIRNRFGSGKSKNNFEAYLMGMVAGIVASPCVGPVLISILTFVSTSRNALLGFSLLFVFASGIGLLFIVIGLFGEALRFLPRSGPWMNFVKFILGAAMWAAALYYLQFAVTDRWWITAVAASFLALSIWQGAFQFRKKAYVRQSIMMALFIFSFTVSLLGVVRPQYLTSAFGISAGSDGSVNGSKKIDIWTAYSDEELKRAASNKQPVLIDFYADWCAACHELEEKTYTHPEFTELSKSFKLLKVDATQDTEAVQVILKKYKVQGLPTVIFINRNGDLLPEITFTQFITWDQLKPKMLESLK